MTLEFIRTVGSAQYDQVIRLRRTVWEHEGVAFSDDSVFADELDEKSVHYFVFDGEKLVASARLSFHAGMEEAPYAPMFLACGIWFTGVVASLNRLVVDPAYRKQGLASRLDQLRIEEAMDSGATALIAAPVGERRMNSLAELGFEVHGICSSRAAEITPPDAKDLALGVFSLDLAAAAKKVASVSAAEAEAG